jgi:hypothetical protein
MMHLTIWSEIFMLVMPLSSSTWTIADPLLNGCSEFDDRIVFPLTPILPSIASFF